LKLAGLVLAILILSTTTTVGAEPQFSYTMSYTFENRGSAAVTLQRDDASIPSFLQTSKQKITLTVTNPNRAENWLDEDGNNFIFLNTPLTLDPGKKISFSATYEIESHDQPIPDITFQKAEDASKISQSLIDQYTSTTTTFPSDDVEIRALAERLALGKTTVLEKVTAMVAWLDTNVAYDSIEIPRYAKETMTEKKGDCDDQSILLISMLRSVGIPAYMEVGIILNSSFQATETSWDGHLATQQNGVGWHGWAMVYIPPWGWTPVDLTYVNERTPLEMIQKAPEYSGRIVPVFKVSNQDYVAMSRDTRERIIKQSIYVTTLDVAATIGTPFWLNPALIALSGALLVSIVVMFISARRTRA
jgi:transglutaminase-like putative cysteine protease